MTLTDPDEAPSRPPSRTCIIAQARADVLAHLGVTATEAGQAWLLDIPVTDYIVARLSGVEHHDILRQPLSPSPTQQRRSTTMRTNNITLETCPNCEGAGEPTCPDCEGAGEVVSPRCQGEGAFPLGQDRAGRDEWTECVRCSGRGRSWCDRCGGAGTPRCRYCDATGSVWVTQPA
ncbi:MAG: hypothetical protein M3Y91_15850 [Actinomycetota bacterium]|nr:hypothetical protein [Actinomycetota bacterium]